MDEEFSNAWMTAHAYETMNNPKLVYLLRQLNETFLTNKHEDLTINNPLSVEHLLPQGWTGHWPFPDGMKGHTVQELYTTASDDPCVAPTRTRNAALQTLGNLTILTHPLNSSVSNGPWKDKRPEILRLSLLPINQALHDYETWDEASIQQRGDELLKRALKRWPRPASHAA
jgi:hypothetical protein